MKLMIRITMHTALIRFAVYEKAEIIIKIKHCYKVTEYEARSVPHGSCEYQTTRWNLAQKSSVCPTEIFVY